MRSTLVLGLALLVATEAFGADPPIPQDTARIEKRRREKLDWLRRTNSGAYDKVGKKDPRWDKLVHEALELACRKTVEPFDPDISHEKISKSAKAAMDAGCDDPLLVHLYTQASVAANNPGAEEATRRIKASARALAAGRYPAFRRAAVLQLAGGITLDEKAATDASRKEGERDFEAALALLAESVATDERNEFWEDRWFEALNKNIRVYRKSGLDGPAAYERVDAKLAAIPELKVLRLRMRGNFWLNYGWEARTEAFAPDVPAGGFELLERRLTVARKALEEAWKLRPDDARTASGLLEIERSIGGDRANMELWFEQAMKADGDDRDACWSKLEWLDPKWHGTAEEMVAFGRQCRDTKNWRAGITLLCADAHYRHSVMLDNEERRKYLASPEVWSDIKSVYDEYIKHYPMDYTARSKYAALAYSSRHFPEAHALFEALGDNLTSWPDFPYTPLEGLKIYRQYTAKVVAQRAAAKKKAAPAKP